MRIVQVCVGKFHHFELASQLYSRGLLEMFYTGYPRYKLRESGLPKNRVRSFPWLMAPYMALQRYGILSSGARKEIAWLAHVTLDNYVARNMPESDGLIALSGAGVRSGRVMKQRGGFYICDRGSSHIRYQDAILREEFERWGATFPGVDVRIMNREEEEYHEADIITVPSEFALNSFIEMGVSKEKLRKVPYGVNLTVFKKVGAPSKEQFDVLFVGQVGFRKGVPYLLQAFSRFAHPSKRLRLVGALQPEMGGFLSRHPTSKDVEFLGTVPHQRLKDIMSQSHVMVLPSVEEGLAYVQAEALACGCPVIGTYNTGATDLFTDGVEGFIMPIRDSAAITEKLQFLADNPVKREEMSQMALKRVNKIGGWRDYGDRMASVIAELGNMKLHNGI